MNIECLVTGAYQENCYVLWKDHQQALIIDPGDNADQILHCIQKNKLNIIGYLCTHAHADHICALHDVHQQYPAPIGILISLASWKTVNLFCIPFLILIIASIINADRKAK